MQKIKLSPFEIFSFAWISVAIVALILAVTNLFYTALLASWIVLIPVGILFFIKKEKLEITPHTQSELWIFAFIASIGIMLSAFVAPTIFGGRDEGSLSTNAILLSQNHSLKHTDEMTKQFFEIYGPGKALNFPGFFYTADGSLKSQFLPAYPAWLATFYSFFGLEGIKFANLFPFITFIFSFFLILKRFSAKPIFNFLGVALLITLFPITLFYKFTLTEIFFAALLWFSLHFVLRHLAEKTHWTFVAIFIPLLITPFLRIESIAFGFTLLFILILMNFEKMKLPRYKKPFIALGIIFFLSLIINAHFFTETVKNFASISPVKDLQESGEIKSFSLFPDDWKNLYILKILFNYNILPLLILGGSYVYALFRKKHWEALVPFFFLMPAFIYLVDANISLDHPWMLRRFMFVIIPLSLFYAVLLIEKTALVKRLPFYIVVVLLILNSSQSALFLTYSENKTLLSQTKSLMENFSDKDLILVSQKSSGNGWSLISEPAKTLLGKNAVYFFNPNDFEKLDTDEFQNVYLIVSDEEKELYKDLEKEKVKDYTITNSIVAPSKDPLAQPSTLETETSGSVYQILED
jgi:hypothetical protein